MRYFHFQSQLDGVNGDTLTDTQTKENKQLIKAIRQKRHGIKRECC